MKMELQELKEEQQNQYFKKAEKYRKMVSKLDTQIQQLVSKHNAAIFQLEVAEEMLEKLNFM